jgi:predicted AlkP superfamily phosphohydrolase/phosphomutase
MLKLIKFAVFISLALTAGYFMLGVSFGDKTLLQHLVTISETKEAQTLRDEIGRKVDDATTDITKKARALAIEKVQSELEAVRKEKTEKATESAIEPDAVSAADKRSLDALIDEKNESEHLNADRRALHRLIRQKNRE